MKRSPLHCKYVFITPPSFEDLERRLRGRGTESEEKIQVRLHTALEEISFGETPGNFDVLITNDDLSRTYDELVRTIRGWSPGALDGEPSSSAGAMAESEHRQVFAFWK